MIKKQVQIFRLGEESRSESRKDGYACIEELNQMILTWFNLDNESSKRLPRHYTVTKRKIR